MKPSDMSAANFIKHLNGRRGWHGNQYRTLCGQWLARNLKTTENMKCETCGATRLDSGCYTAEPCSDCENSHPAEAPAIGAIFRNGDLGDCTVTKVWKSKFGDWKVSYADARGGGGIINLDHFDEVIAKRQPETRS